MEFNSEEEAKNYSVGVTAKHFNLGEANQKIEDYKRYRDNARSEEDKQSWIDELQKLEEWVNSGEFQNGYYPQGLDELVLELIEWRASLYAFQKVDTECNPFTEHVFHAQWLMGGTYTVFCILGKLVSKDGRDNSLRKLWDDVKTYLAQSGLCGEGEIALIEQKMHKSEGHFTNENSSAMLFRNKVIAHNESMPRIEWSEVDKDIELLSRVWSLITMWSSFGIIEPFRSSERAFSGLENVFRNKEIQLLKEHRDEYINFVKKWFVSSLVDGEKVCDRSPIGKIEISFSTNINNR